MPKSIQLAKEPRFKTSLSVARVKKTNTKTKVHALSTSPCRHFLDAIIFIMVSLFGLVGFGFGVF